MNCLQQNSATRRYLIRFVSTIAAYAVALLFADWALHRFHPTGWLLYALAVLPAIPIIGVIVVVGLYLAEEKDEFQRNLLIQSMLWGLGGVLVFTSAWGSLETFVHIRHFNPSWTYLLFWIFFILRTPFLLRKYR